MILLKRITLIGLLTLAQVTAFAQYPANKLPAYRTQNEIQLMVENRKANKRSQFDKTGFDMPNNVRYPGEFEENQAICISWSYDYDNNGNVIGVDTSSEYGWISAQLTKYISDELPVWIRVPKNSDTTVILTHMQNIGWPLTNNYRFFVVDGDDWWMRDFGPNGIYYGDKDSLAFIDMKYYDGRDLDNEFPKTIASFLKVPNYVTKLNGEGGNLMSDGFGQVFMSDVFDDANQFINGWDSTETMDTLSNLFGSTKNINTKALQCDGGTGHIDLYTKLLDEQTMVLMEYPSVITAIDKKIIEDNFQIYSTLKTTYNRPFRIHRFPMPTGDAGTYNRKTCTAIDADARTYINSITLNKTLLYPSYSDDLTGNKTQTLAATAQYQKLLPGYKIIPIDARAASVGGGSIHCITMQIPADNPVLIWHPSIDGFGTIAPSYPIVAKITNRSGIATATCKWKKRGTAVWNSTPLVADTGNMFNGSIVPGALLTTDTLDYYIEVTTNNGKTVTKPLSAPNGFYTIQFKGYPTSNSELVEVVAKNYLYGAFPNPASNQVTIPFQLVQVGEALITLMDITGKEITTESILDGKIGLNHANMDLTGIQTGLYLYTLSIDSVKIDTRKLMINHK